MHPHRRTVPAMARETKARKTTATHSKADHCRHCGATVKVKDGLVVSHPDPQSTLSSECAGTRAQPLES